MDIPIEDILELSPEIILDLLLYIDFTYEIHVLAEYNNYPKEYKDFYIGHQPWKKLEECKQIINKLDDKDIMNAAADIVKIYTGIDINKKPVTEVLGYATFFLNRYLSFISVLLN